ncbi:MAG: glycerophosphodiester phosphodiesterase, partial [Deltaproteobacteria bacterium]
MPENTLDAFAAAVRAGAERLELDVHATADGEIVVMHDDHVDRTTDGSGPVRSFSLAALRRLDAGHRFRTPDGTYPYRGRGLGVPTLGELLEAIPDVPLNIEVKQLEPPLEAAVLA